MRDQVFISYSHKDKQWLELLKTHLTPFEGDEARNRLQVWDDKRIRAGTQWRDEIETALQSARVAILLVSANFLASKFITKIELPALLKAAEKEGLTIIWVAVSASAYTETELGHYQAANDADNPLDCLHPALAGQELVRICQQVKEAMGETNGQLRNKSTTETSISQLSDQPRPRIPAAAVRIGLVVLAVAVLVTGAGFVYTRLKAGPSTNAAPPASLPLSTVEFRDSFDNPGRWQTPSSGWAIKDGRIVIENQAELGFVPHVNYGDLEMGFHLRLENAKGAAWAIHVQPNGRDYYLFYLSGPEGQIPNRFLTYVVHDNKVVPTLFQDSVALSETPEVNGQYQITMTVDKNHITHRIESAQTGEDFNLGDFTDEGNTFASGSFGFRTIGGEKFSVDDLYVRPPNVKPPQ